MSFALFGLGTALPPAEVSLSDGLGIARALAGPTARQSGFLPAVYHGTGNRTRRQVIGRDVVDDVLNATAHTRSVFLPTGDPLFRGPTTAQRMRIYAAEAPQLAVEAARIALAGSGFAPASITQLVTVSCTGFVAPGIDLALIRGLGLPATVQRTHIGFMGCHGALNGLRVANAFATDPAARVLVCAVELCSIHYHYGDDPEKVVANALFADGAAAAVGASDPGADCWRVAATGSCVIPDSADLMGWTIGDVGFEMSLAKKVPATIAAHLRPWLEGWLSDNGVSLDAVGSWAVHPGGPKILDAVGVGLGLPPAALAASQGVFADYGNMSSPTVLFILDRLRRAGAPRPCVMLGFGPGLVAEAVLWR
jgi:predicted naringenin-chalcone synthase